MLFRHGAGSRAVRDDDIMVNETRQGLLVSHDEEDVYSPGGQRACTNGGQAVEVGVDSMQFNAEALLLIGMTSDAAPYRDNVNKLHSDRANMNLKRGGDALHVGMSFKNKVELHKAISMYSIKRLFNFKVQASDKTRVIYVCSDRNCHWRVYATMNDGSSNVEVRTATLTHSCDISTRSHYGKKATASILGELLKARYAHGKEGPRACDVPQIVLSDYNVTISYMKAWYAKEVAMKKGRRGEEESYEFLSRYLHLLTLTNPGTISRVKTVKGTVDGPNLFKYLFVAFGASVVGYKHLRKVIVIDGTQTKGKYKSCLVAASGQDGNYQIFPLAFGIIDGENIAGWTWFFSQLSTFVHDAGDLVFISDRHQAIYAGLKKVYPLARHGACVVHLHRNVKHRFKCEGLANMVSNAARAYTIGFSHWILV